MVLVMMEYDVVSGTDVNNLHDSLRKLAKANVGVIATVDKLVILERKAKSKDNDNTEDEESGLVVLEMPQAVRPDAVED